MFRAIDKWLPGYLQSVLRRPRNFVGPRHLIFCLADHFEPLGNASNREEAVRLVRNWTQRYREKVGAFRDSDGIPPQHTFFFPAEEYDAECLNLLAELCAGGLCEVEVHLHHRNDTADGLRTKLNEFRDLLHDRHRLLGEDAEGNARYGFIHGNWALCNSRPDGDWCGVNEELTVLSQTGCYGDFTFPSAPSPTQPRMVNAIYRVRDRIGKPRGADRGELVRVNKPSADRTCEHPASNIQHRTSNEERIPSDLDVRCSMFDVQYSYPETSASSHTPIPPHSHTPLLLIQGPLALDWKRRKWGVFPRLENGDITAVNPPLPRRIDLWVRQGIHVLERPDWIFVKVYTHGCAVGNRDALLGETMRRAHECLTACYNDGFKWRLHYVTAREMYNMVRAAEDGKHGNPGNYRDYEIGKPERR